MKQNLEQKELESGAPVVAAAGANPAGSIKLLGKNFYQEDEENSCGKHASGFEYDCFPFGFRGYYKVSFSASL